MVQRVIGRLREQAAPSTRSPPCPTRRSGSWNSIGEGLTNRQIAERMFLSEKTAKNYVSSVLTKLGMQRRTQAAAFVARLGTHQGEFRAAYAPATWGHRPHVLRHRRGRLGRLPLGYTLTGQRREVGFDRVLHPEITLLPAD